MFLCFGIDKNSGCSVLPILVPLHVAKHWRSTLAKPTGTADAYHTSIGGRASFINAPMDVSKDEIASIVIHHRGPTRTFWCVFRVKGSAGDLHKLLIAEWVIRPIRALVYSNKMLNAGDTEKFRRLGDEISLKTSLVVTFDESFLLCWPGGIDLIKEFTNGFFLTLQS